MTALTAAGRRPRGDFRAALATEPAEVGDRVRLV
jgi:hypothetical protein